jgi:hypothetical protein
MTSRQRALLLVILAAAATTLNVGGVLLADGPLPLYVIGAIINGALLVVATLALRREGP